MDCLPKLMARKFEWVENVSMLRIWMILISILLVCPFLGVVLIKIDISLLLFVCGIYFSFLLGLLYDKYYSSEFMLLKASKRRSGLIQNMFLLLIFLVWSLIKNGWVSILIYIFLVYVFNMFLIMLTIMACSHPILLEIIR